MSEKEPLERDEPLPQPDSNGSRRRSIAIALALGGLVVLFYLVTIVRMGGSVAKRAI